MVGKGSTRKIYRLAIGEFSVPDAINFSNIFLEFHDEIQEEVSFGSARVLLNFSLKNFGIREDRSTRLF
jgi:hypothetical protein